jgi:hypothetical protein
VNVHDCESPVAWLQTASFAAPFDAFSVTLHDCESSQLAWLTAKVPEAVSVTPFVLGLQVHVPSVGHEGPAQFFCAADAWGASVTTAAVAPSAKIVATAPRRVRQLLRDFIKLAPLSSSTLPGRRHKRTSWVGHPSWPEARGGTRRSPRTFTQKAEVGQRFYIVRWGPRWRSSIQQSSALVP